jgi:hypothetical protein
MFDDIIKKTNEDTRQPLKHKNEIDSATLTQIRA